MEGPASRDAVGYQHGRCRNSCKEATQYQQPTHRDPLEAEAEAGVLGTLLPSTLPLSISTAASHSTEGPEVPSAT